ncbi:MAG TPA: nuclear transport factor 2 family protein [Candidatus Kapabacteria bacterium]|nr:nuclear transport factor 2 family protein [Candidatus Kapabacteria bacterium]HOV92495.1 nuclear transport factor 2 family protein [Candidatus Kapabacteria bacterium]
MKQIILLAFICALLIPVLIGCQSEPKALTVDEINKEKQAIVQVIENYNRASERKNFAELVNTLADSVTFFGTDEGEVITTFADFKKAIEDQWNEYDYTKYSPLTDVYIVMDKNATLASILFGVSFEASKGGVSENLFIRGARTLKKQDGKWVIVSGLLSVPRPKVVTTPIDTTKVNTEVKH